MAYAWFGPCPHCQARLSYLEGIAGSNMNPQCPRRVAARLGETPGCESGARLRSDAAGRSRLPHAWVARAGERLSVLDLLPCDGFTVLAGPEGAAWAEAVAGIRGLPLRCLIA